MILVCTEYNTGNAYVHILYTTGGVFDRYEPPVVYMGAHTHLRRLCAPHTSSGKITTRKALAWSSAVVEAVVAPKRESTIGDTGLSCRPGQSISAGVDICYLVRDTGLMIAGCTRRASFS